MPLPASQPRAGASGFSLLELLVVVVLGLLVIGAITSVVVAQVKVSRNQLTSQQLRNDWTRLTYFLANEVGEGRRVVNDTTAAELSANGCSLPTGGTLLFSIRVPIGTDTGAPVERLVHYYTTGTGTGTTLFRCGPPIETTGRLNSTATTFTPARLLTGIPLTATIDTNNVAVTLTPTVTGANIVPFAVRTRSILIP